MTEPRGFAYVMLETTARETSEPPAAFYDQLLNIGEEISTLEQRLADLSLHPVGFRAQTRITDVEKRYVSLLTDIEEAYEAVASGEPWRFGRIDHNWSTLQLNEFFNYEITYLERIEELRSEAARLGQLINSKRNSANTRLAAAVSCVAAIISAVAVILSSVSLIF